MATNQHRVIDELRRRIEALENKTTHLQQQNAEMYKVLKSKNSFLDFSFSEDYENTNERHERRRIARHSLLRNIRNMNRDNG